MKLVSKIIKMDQKYYDIFHTSTLMKMIVVIYIIIFQEVSKLQQNYGHDIKVVQVNKCIFTIKKKKNKHSLWEAPNTAKVNFAKVIQTRVIWNWPSNQSLTMNDFVNNIHQKNM